MGYGNEIKELQMKDRRAAGTGGIREEENSMRIITTELLEMYEKYLYHNKGKIRKVLIPGKLRVQLMAYIAEMKIAEGIVFCTKSGKSVSRTNIWRDMKKLCKKAGVNEDKVFPHNLRHLFARTYYEAKKDIAKLADIMGHGSIETTRIYLRCSINEYMKELDSLGLVV